MGGADPCRINTLVVKGLLFTLVACIAYECTLTALSWWRAAADGSGVNSSHEAVKTILAFVLGALSGIVQGRIVGNHEAPPAPPPQPAP